MGFSIRKEVFSKNKQTCEMTSAIFVCSKERFCKKDWKDLLSKRLEAKTRMGQLCIKLNRKRQNYYVYHFVEIYNRPLIREECARLSPS